MLAFHFGYFDCDSDWVEVRGRTRLTVSFVNKRSELSANAVRTRLVCPDAIVI